MSGDAGLWDTETNIYDKAGPFGPGGDLRSQVRDQRVKNCSIHPIVDQKNPAREWE